MNRDTHAAAGVVVVDRIADDVAYRLQDLSGVANAIDLRALNRKRDPFFIGKRLKQLDGFHGDSGEVAALKRFRCFIRIEAGQRQQRFDHPAHALRRTLADLKAFSVFGGRTLAGESGLRLRKHYGDRSPQLVRCVGRELRLPGKDGLQA